ncbi:MAG TPA: helix-turn-helix transcriptional regulator [Fimbriimonadaceae bacterium]|nr:helix-turn-helix transcriptional regulator [Fimbriimonadaceae bacterium]
MSTALPTNVRTLGDAVRFLRERQGISLRQLATKVGVSAPFLSDLERNRRSTEKLDQLATALDVSVEVLQELDGRMTPDLKEWIAANPGMIAVLREIRSSGRRPDEIRAALTKRRR